MTSHTHPNHESGSLSRYLLKVALYIVVMGAITIYVIKPEFGPLSAFMFGFVAAIPLDWLFIKELRG